MSRSSLTIGTRRRHVLVGLCLCLAALTASLGGCSRKYWREQADDLSYDIIRKKELDPRWEVPRIDVMPDPRSRFYDPYDPDFTPLPPDDPTAHQYMHWLYGMRGYRKWHDFGDLPAVENPDWLEPFGMSSEIVAANYSKPALLPEIQKLTLEEAIELSWVHNRDYQTQIENVYLLALQLTFERFQFDLQFIGFSGRPSTAVNLEDVPSTSDSVALDSAVGVRQLFPTGAQFIAELANNTLWLFAGGKTQDSSASVISYSLIQPLLAGAGRRFVLEGLTQSERNMLYGLRDLARFRMGFFTSTVAGGQTAGLAQGVQGAPQPLGALTTPLVQTGQGTGGYLGLLQQIQVVNNQRYNIRQLKERLDRLHAAANTPPTEISEELPELPPALIEELDAPRDPDEEPAPAGLEARPRKVRILKLPQRFAGRIRYSFSLRRLFLRGGLTDAEEQELLDLTDDQGFRLAIANLADRSVMEIETVNQQIAQLQTQLASQCNTLRSTVVNLLDSIDRFKLFLGLPPDMPLSIDDSLIKPFELIDPRIVRLQDRLNMFVPDPPPISENHPDIVAIQRALDIWKQFDPARIDPQLLLALADQLAELEQDIRTQGIDVLAADFQRYDEHEKARPPKPVADDCLQVYRDEEADVRLQQILLQNFVDSAEQLRTLRSRLRNGEITADNDLRRAVLSLSDLREDFLRITQSLSVVQINLRVDLIDLNQFEIPLEDAVRTALENRMDLMNSRAQVMDARRNVEVAANQLQALLNVVVAGDVRTQSTFSGNLNPFDFRGDQSSLRAGVQFTAPVQIVQQRNDYRAALIAYQRARRNYMRTEDQVKLDIRVNWRQLNVLKQNFETARENVRAATAQLDIAVEQSSAPVIAGAGGGGGGGAAGAAGTAQGLNILNALSSVLTAQNQMIQIWVQFESNRLSMYNFMGTLEIDEYGFWVDDFYQRRALAARAGQGVVEVPPEPLSEFSPARPPQELNDVPAARPDPENLDAPEALAPEPEPPAGARRRSVRDATVQLVKAETWPERPAAPAPRSGRKADSGAADPGERRNGGRVVLEGTAERAAGGADRPDRRNRQARPAGSQHH